VTELDADLVRRKAAAISRNLDALEVIDGIDLDAYRSDLFRKKGTERLLQETIEAAVDANLHILRTLGAATPADYYESFIALGDAGVIPAELAKRLAPAAGLRNRLVHEYDEIDDQIVLKAVSVARRTLRDYVAAIERHVASSEE
jgi:uncharacterized protein YutE (UPF0331/DUF86 family)